MVLTQHTLLTVGTTYGCWPTHFQQTKKDTLAKASARQNQKSGNFKPCCVSESSDFIGSAPKRK